MRKSVAISLLLIYIISSSGVAIRAYYNSGKLTSINLILDRSSEKKAPLTVQKDAKSNSKNDIANCKPAAKKSESNSLKKVLQCVTIVSNGFFEAYDDADTTPACNTCAGASATQVYPSHMVSID